MLVPQRQSEPQPWQPCVLGMQRGMLGQRPIELGTRRGTLSVSAMLMHFYCVMLNGSGNDDVFGDVTYLYTLCEKNFWPPWALGLGSLGWLEAWMGVGRWFFHEVY